MPSKEIGGVVYDTEDAEQIATFYNSSSPAHPRYREEVLYRTESGEYFLYSEDGPQGELVPDWRTGRCELWVLDDEQVLSWCESKNIDSDAVPDEFSHLVGEDAANQNFSKIPIYR